MTTHSELMTAVLRNRLNTDDPTVELNKELGELGYLNRGLVIGPDGQACLTVNDPADDFEARTGIPVMPRLRVEFLPKLSKRVLLRVS
jgi:hypothetical protein